MRKTRHALEHADEARKEAAAQIVDRAVNVVGCASGAVDAIYEMLQSADGEEASHCRDIAYLVVNALGKCSSSLEDALDMLR